MICRGITFFPLTLNEMYFLDSAHQPHFFLLKPSLCFEKGIEKSLFYSLYKLDILSHHPNHWPTGSPKQLNLLPWETYRTCERCLFKSSLTTCHWHGFYFLKYPTVPRPTSQENRLFAQRRGILLLLLSAVSARWWKMSGRRRPRAFQRINYIQQCKVCHLLFSLSFPQRWGFVYWPEKAFHTGGALFKQRWCKCAAFSRYAM